MQGAPKQYDPVDAKVGIGRSESGKTMQPLEAIQHNVEFPASSSAPDQSTIILCKGSVVVVGANGSGKSRLGTWLELRGPQKDKVLRIAAQRSIVFPEISSPLGLAAARNALQWAPVPTNWDEATFESNKFSLRLQRRYGGVVSNAETAPLSDFNELVTFLFSENYSALLAHEDDQRKTPNLLVPMPESILRKVQTFWEQLLPHRILRFTGSEVRVFAINDPLSDYPARAMSDGERVVFYLVGQVLCAEAGAIIVVDEPELHLHKALQTALWDLLEGARPDCVFVYLTHDLVFAADRVDATKICVTAYVNGSFDWFALADQQDMPEEVLLEVLGSRKPVLFVEGTSGSLDAWLYRLVYPRFTVKPVGGCASVLMATKAFRALEDMHHIRSFGIVDRDYMEHGQIEACERAGVFTLSVAEIENVLLVPELMRSVATQLVVDIDIAVSSAVQYILEDFRRWLPTHAIEMTQFRVALMLGRFSSQQQEINAYANEFAQFQSTINPTVVYADALREALEAIDSGDIKRVLPLFNKKGLSGSIGRFFGITNATYVDKIKAMAKQGLGDVGTRVAPYLPDMEAKI